MGKSEPIRPEDFNFEYYEPVIDQNIPFETGMRIVGPTTFQFVKFTKDRHPYWDYKIWSIKNPECERMIKKQISQFVNGYLTAKEQAALNFIATRTLCWGKVNEKIRKIHFLEGIPNVIGPWIINPNKMRLDETIKALEEKSLIRIIDKTNYHIDFKGLNQWVTSHGGGIMLRKPKKKNNEKGNTTLPSAMQKGNTTLPYKEPTCYSSKELTNKPASHARSNFSQNSPIEPTNQQKFKQITQEVSSISSHKAKIILADSKAPSKFIKYWHDLTREYHPKSIVWVPTGKASGQLKNFLKDTGLPKEVTTDQFFNFCVEKWFAIGDIHFGYANKKAKEQGKQVIEFPDYPDLGFVMTYKSRFLSAFQRDTIDQLSPDYAYRKKLEREGYSREQIDTFITQKKLNTLDTKKAKESIAAQKHHIELERLQLEQDKKNYQFHKSTLLKRLKQIDPVVREDDPALKDLANKWLETCTWLGYEAVYSLLLSYGEEAAYKIIFGVDKT